MIRRLLGGWSWGTGGGDGWRKAKKVSEDLVKIIVLLICTQKRSKSGIFNDF